MSKKRRTIRKRSEAPKESHESFFNSGHSSNDASGTFFNSAQAKLKIGAPGDKHEKQADAMASKVVNTPSKSDSVQKSSDFKIQRQGVEEEPQAKLQKQGEEEEMQTKLQRQGEEEEMQTKLQRQGEEEEMQTKLQRQEEEEEPAQAKLQRKEETTARPDFEEKLVASKGGGSPLPKEILEEMEQKFGVSFKKVRIHTDRTSQELCDEINAQAFTKGNHIYFNKGKFNPYTIEGKFLLAHELTHIIQQGSAG